MNKRVRAAISSDEGRGPSRYTRLLLSDDEQVVSRGGTPSAVIADLVRKGLRYEALERGAGDPVLRALLRDLNDIVRHQVHQELEAASAPLLDEIRRTQLYLSTLFMIVTGRVELTPKPLSQAELEPVVEVCRANAREMFHRAAGDVADTAGTGRPTPTTAPDFEN